MSYVHFGEKQVHLIWAWLAPSADSVSLGFRAPSNLYIEEDSRVWHRGEDGVSRGRCFLGRAELSGRLALDL